VRSLKIRPTSCDPLMNGGCIWCLGPASGGHDEHIIPEALGCPDGFILPGDVVCRSCNNGLAHLDQAVADEFDFFSFGAGIPRKRGRAPAIKSRGNAIATIEPTGPTYSFNMESYPVTAHDGTTLAPFKGGQRNIRVNCSKGGQEATLSFNISIGDNPKFIRGLTKIALSSLAYFVGASVARSSRFDAIREFVIKGKGVRYVMVKAPESNEYSNCAWVPYLSESGDYVCIFRIAVCEFVVDLGPTQSALTELEVKACEIYGETGWSILPARN